MMKELVLKNRSYRSFSRETIGEKKLQGYVDLARVTASTANLQALKYRIVHTEEECRKTFSATKWAGYLSYLQIPPAKHEPTAYIIICVDNDITKNTTAFFKDTGIAAQTILLAATEDGFGGCMIGSFDEGALREALDLPENLTVTLVLGMGRPDEVCELTEVKDDIKYYRENSIHYVPKRSLDEVLI